jgi:hypothetical protein
MLDSSHRSVIDLAGGFVLPVSQAFASGDTAWLGERRENTAYSRRSSKRVSLGAQR